MIGWGRKAPERTRRRISWNWFRICHISTGGEKLQIESRIEVEATAPITAWDAIVDSVEKTESFKQLTVPKIS